jgi:predicted lipid carrier protein YhbT
MGTDGDIDAKIYLDNMMDECNDTLKIRIKIFIYHY